MNRLKCGSTIKRNSWMPEMPSMRAASRISSLSDCMPASRMSIINGAQRQTTMPAIATSGNWASQSTAGRPTNCMR